MKNYEINKDRFDKILSNYQHISELSIYRTHLKIATNEYVVYLNNIPMNVGVNSHGKESFVKKIGSKFVVNTKTINRAISVAAKSNEFEAFHFFFAEYVLDILEESLNSRK